MSSPEFEDRTLIQYLLGNLAEADAERFDALSVSDDAVAAKLCNTENDLVDAYVRGDLQGEDTERFHSQYLISPRRRRKVEFAQSLFQLEQKATPVSPNVPRRFALPMPWLQALAAGMLLAVAVGIGLDDVRVRRNWSNEHASVTKLSSRASESIQDLAAEKARTNALTAQTKRLEALIGELHTSDTAAASTKPHLVRSPSFLILPSKKGTDVPSVLAVPTDAKQLEIRLVLDDDGFRQYRVNLKSGRSAAVLWQSPILNAERHEGSTEFKLILPAKFFKGGVYNLEVNGLPPGPEESIKNYAFIEQCTTVIVH